MRFAAPKDRLRSVLDTVPRPADGGRSLALDVVHGSCGCPGTLVLHEVEEVADVAGHGRMLVRELRWEVWFQHLVACRNGDDRRTI